MRQMWLLLASGQVDFPPDREGGQRLVESELQRSIYHPEPSLLAEFIQWAAHYLGLDNLSFDGLKMSLGQSAIVIMLVTLVLLVALMVGGVIGPRSHRRAPLANPQAIFDEQLTRVQYLHAASQASKHGDWTTAYIEHFRAMVMTLDGRGFITEYPGLTATEVATTCCKALPKLERELAEHAEIFNLLRFGRRRATQAQVEALRRLDEAVSAAPLPQAFAQEGPARV